MTVSTTSIDGAALPDPGPGRVVATRVGAIAFGVVTGIAWAAALRAYMALLVSSASQVDWAATFVGILLPGAILGGLLAWAELLRRGGGARHARWLVLAPIVLAVFPMLLPGAVVALVTTGLGGGAPAIAVYALVGGFALSGRGPLAARIACAVLAAVFVALAVIATPEFGGPWLALDRPRGAFVAVLGASTLVVLAGAASIPHRIPVPARTSSRRASSGSARSGVDSGLSRST